MPRLVSFDIAKALCIILVAIGHYFPTDSPLWYVAFRSWIYSFHMPLFMFASGYIYMAFKKDEPYTAFVTKKNPAADDPVFCSFRYCYLDKNSDTVFDVC